MPSPRFEAERSRILSDAGIPGKKVYITSPEILARAQRLGKEIHPVPGTPLYYYIDLSNCADAEMDELVRLKLLDLLNQSRRSLSLLCIVTTVFAVLAAVELLIIILLLALL